jgi:hypothetical protein
MEAPSYNPADWREWRRMRALDLKQQGWRQRDIASVLAASEVSVSRWLARARRGGREALLARPRTGSAAEALAPAEEPDPGVPLAWPGGLRLSWPGLDLRPHRRGDRGGVRRPLPQGSRRAAAPGTTVDAPGADQAGHRDEPAIERWRTEVWPELVRRARLERRVLVFEDESGFYLLPGVVRTYAPEGQTPILRGEADARPPVGHGRDDA